MSNITTAGRGVITNCIRLGDGVNIALPSSGNETIAMPGTGILYINMLSNSTTSYVSLRNEYSGLASTASIPTANTRLRCYVLVKKSDKVKVEYRNADLTNGMFRFLPFIYQ